MFIDIQSNLHRQFKALELLEQLLDEEYLLLQARDTDAITNLEFSIHELLRQVARERISLKDSLQGTPVLEYAGLLTDDEQSTALQRLYHLIDGLEQRCARQASHNAELSLALLDQGQSLLNFLQEKISPRVTGVYGAAGKIRQSRPSAAIYSGRF